MVSVVSQRGPAALLAPIRLRVKSPSRLGDLPPAVFALGKDDDVVRKSKDWTRRLCPSAASKAGSSITRGNQKPRGSMDWLR